MIAAPAFARVSGGATVTTGASVSTGGTSVTVDAKVEARISTAKSHADQEIDRRISALNDLNTRVQAMAKVSADEKTSIANSVSSEISDLTTLKAKIDADADITSLKTDIKSITGSYRIFMLIIPQGRIEVASDRVKSVADLLTSFSAKLQSRISDAQASGKDVTSLSASVTDMNAKIADANAQADAAVTLVANLKPDNGDKTTMTANSTALKSARADIASATKDLQAARADSNTIVRGLHSIGASANASASSTATSQAQ